MMDLRYSKSPDGGERHASTVAATLRRQSIASVKRLAGHLGLPATEVRSALAPWVARGQVELLRPWGCQPVADDELDYYRWRRPTDRDYLWEQDFMRCACPTAGRWRGHILKNIAETKN